jgi:hypothetical protein
MNRFGILIIALLLVIVVYILVIRQGPCDCAPLSIDQHDGVGTFVSFGRDPMSPDREPEVAPARIRARGGEKVTWVLRNPSDRDIMVGLHSVIGRDPDRNLMNEVFEHVDPPVRIDKGCGIAALQGRLDRGLLRDESLIRGAVPDRKRLDDCDSSLVFHYFFMIQVMAGTSGKRDSVVCRWPYDPELVIERDP